LRGSSQKSPKPEYVQLWPAVGSRVAGFKPVPGTADEPGAAFGHAAVLGLGGLTRVIDADPIPPHDGRPEPRESEVTSNSHEAKRRMSRGRSSRLAHVARRTLAAVRLRQIAC
jgi:hypothetical protein